MSASLDYTAVYKQLFGALMQLRNVHLDSLALLMRYSCGMYHETMWEWGQRQSKQE